VSRPSAGGALGNIPSSAIIPAKRDAAQETGELVAADRFAEVETLHRVTGVVGEERLLLLGLHSFRDHGEAQGLAHGDDRLGDRPVLDVSFEVTDEGTIHLERVDRIALDLRELRISDAEVGQRDAHAELFYGGQHLARPFVALHHHGLGQLELQEVRFHAAFFQRGEDVGGEPFVGELARRQIDRHAHRRQAFALPRDVLRAGRFQYPPADRHDQTCFLGDGDEARRGHQAEVRMPPAQQGFHAGDLLRPQIELRLVVQGKFVPLQRMTQARFQREPLERIRPDVLGEELEIVFALLFREIHGDVGVFHQRLLVLRVGRIHADADARRHPALLPQHDDRLHGRGEELARGDGDLLRIRHLLQEHHEFVAAQARDDIARAQAVLETRAHFLQQLVSRFVPQGVVDDLEAVEVDEHHGKAAAVALRHLDLVVEELAEHHPVRQRGERVVCGHVLDAFLGPLALHELADLAADHPHRLQQPVLRLADFAAVENQHPDRLAFRHDRKEECAMHAGVAGDPRLGPGVRGEIGDPQGLSRLKCLPHQSGTGSVGQHA
jgi:hypothetical protein